MGDPDLSAATPDADGRPGAVSAASLTELIRGGNRDALAGFRDAHIGNVRGYCLQACGLDDAEAATQAALRDFIGRVRTQNMQDSDLEDVLLKATRSAAAGRFLISDQAAETSRRAHAAVAATCSAMPELLAAQANGELRGSGETLGAHAASCSVCAATSQRMREAESAFARAGHWLATE